MSTLLDMVSASIRGHLDTDAHLLTIFSLALSLKARNILELGVKDGNTTQALILAAMQIEGSNVVSIDTSMTSYIPSEEGSKVWKFIQQDSIEYLANLHKHAKFDLIFLDDWHSYQHVKEELRYLDAHVTPSSLILVHDTMYGNSQPVYHTDLTLKEGQWANGGPYRAVAELNPQFWEFSTIPIGHGLTILRKKYTNKFLVGERQNVGAS